MLEFLAQAVNGLAIGSVYAVVALGFVLIFGVAKVINFAQGSQVVVAAYLAWTAATYWNLPLILAFGVALIGSLIIALIVDLIAVEWLGKSAEIAPLLSTLALALILDQSIRLIWSPNPLKFPNPLAGATIELGNFYISATDLLILSLTIIFMIAFAVLLKTTWMGRSIRASAQDAVAAEQMGIHTRPTKLIAFGMSGVIGALGGVLVGMYFQQIDPMLGLPLGLKGFAAAMVGGVISLPGAVVGGLMIGVFEGLASGYFGSGYRDLVAFVLLLAVMIFRPQGLLGSNALKGLGGTRGAGAIPTTSPLADNSGFPVTVMGSRFTSMKWTYFVVAAIGIIATFLLGTYWSGVIAQGAIYATAALALTVLTGMTGYVSVGHAALMGLGAYYTARITTLLDWPFELVLISVIIVGIIGGLIFAYPILRLEGHTIALATLALGQIGYLFMLNSMAVTKGPMGIGSIPKPSFAILGGNGLDFKNAMTLIAFGVLIIGLCVVHLLHRGQMYISFRAIREDKLAAEAYGIQTKPYIAISFAISGILAGLGGMMFAYQQSFVSPDSFLILFSILMLTMVLAGGIVSPLGAVLGAILLISIPEILREHSEYRDLIYGAILIIVIKYLPSGISAIRTPTLAKPFLQKLKSLRFRESSII